VVYYGKSGTFDVSLVAENAFGSDSLLKENYITVGTTGTGTLKTDGSSVEIFPNPAFDEIIIRSKHPAVSEIRIYNAAGDLLKICEHMLNTKSTLDISFLPEGHYYIQIRQGNHAVVKKFVKGR
jgi:hypothetical protein